ncbi:MAG: hypothetical protein J6B87_02025, partial [Clostridia bacterium]|nr:hypothetical protein [Clostridia bacterium]
FIMKKKKAVFDGIKETFFIISFLLGKTDALPVTLSRSYSFLFFFKIHTAQPFNGVLGVSPNKTVPPHRSICGVVQMRILPLIENQWFHHKTDKKKNHLFFLTSGHVVRMFHLSLPVILSRSYFCAKKEDAFSNIFLTFHIFLRKFSLSSSLRSSPYHIIF